MAIINDQAWIGLDSGEVFIPETSLRKQLHASCILRIIPNGNTPWTIDMNTLKSWNLDFEIQSNCRVSRHTCGIRVNSIYWALVIIKLYELKIQLEKSVTIYNIPTSKIIKILHFATLGTVICLHDTQVITGHENGTIVAWCATTYTQLFQIEISVYKITSCLSLDKQLWFGLSTGKIIIHENHKFEKEFFAIEGEIVSLLADYESDALGVVATSDKGIKIMDGLLEDDYCGSLMKKNNTLIVRIGM